MQFRLSTLLLAILVFSTSLALMGSWGVVCACNVILLVGLFRECLPRGAMAVGCLILSVGVLLDLPAVTAIAFPCQFSFPVLLASAAGVDRVNYPLRSAWSGLRHPPENAGRR